MLKSILRGLLKSTAQMKTTPFEMGPENRVWFVKFSTTIGFAFLFLHLIVCLWHPQPRKPVQVGWWEQSGPPVKGHCGWNVHRRTKPFVFKHKMQASNRVPTDDCTVAHLSCIVPPLCLCCIKTTKFLWQQDWCHLGLLARGNQVWHCSCHQCIHILFLPG